MVHRVLDKFTREDGDIGPNYLIPCGGVAIFDESVLPVDVSEAQSGLSPILDGTTDQKTQVLYNAEVMDSPDQVVRAVWSHDPVELGSDSVGDPAFTLLARMSKDPLLVDLGLDEQPYCYDQGYGLRITFPRDGSEPILKIVKYTTRAIPPGYPADASTEPDGAVVLSSVTLQSDNLNLDPTWDGTGDLPYQGFVQDTRLRIRRSDNEVILEAYLNDRNMNTRILEYRDTRTPLWGVTGLPGFEFLSATLATQPVGASPFELAGVALLKCHLFQVETIKDFRRPVTSAPGNFYTYNEVTNRVITLVEKDGDARYTATEAGQTKQTTYLNFVLEAEAEIIRKEGYYHWLYRTADVYLEDGKQDYELPEDCGLIEMIRPGNWASTPLSEAHPWNFRNRLAGVTQSGGKPTIYTMTEETTNNRKRILLFPIPTVSAIQVTGSQDPFLTVEYYARRVRPHEPDIQIPYVPQEHIDVLVYGAAAHALLLDTDPGNAQMFAQVYQGKLESLRRENNRKASSRQTVIRSAADVIPTNVRSRIPLLRATQLETLLI